MAVEEDLTVVEVDKCSIFTCAARSSGLGKVFPHDPQLHFSILPVSPVFSAEFFGVSGLAGSSDSTERADLGRAVDPKYELSVGIPVPAKFVPGMYGIYV